MATKKEDANSSEFSLADSARDIWLAGLGAFARTQSQGEKVFTGLVKEGEAFQQSTRKDVEARVQGLRGRVESSVTAVRKRVDSRLTSLESVFEDRVARSLGRLGVPTAKDVQLLTEQVQQLSKEVKAMGGSAASSVEKAA